jgi:hypothetical protein
MKLFLLTLATVALWVVPTFGQTATVIAKPLTDSDIQILRSDVQAQKNDIITHTMRFTDTESMVFWPLYRDFVRDQQVIGGKRLEIIKSYAKNLDKMDDATAQDLTQRMIGVDNETATLRRDYWPRFQKALGGKRAAQFYQVDRRLSLIVDLQLTSEIPLIP